MDPIHRNMQVYVLTSLVGSCVSHDVVISLIFFGHCVKFLNPALCWGLGTNL